MYPKNQKMTRMAGMDQRWREQDYEAIEVSKAHILKEAMKRTLHFIQRAFKRFVIRCEFLKFSLAFVWLMDKKAETVGGYLH